MSLYLYSEEDFSEEESDASESKANDSIDPAVSISKRIIEALLSKTEQHNKGCTLGGGVSLNQVKSVYVKGCNNRFNSHKTLNQCALARVNMFLSISNGTSLGKFFDVPIGKENLNKITSLVFEDEKNIVCSSVFDVLDEWNPSAFFFDMAEDDIRKHDLDIVFKDVSELYLEVDNRDDDLKDWLDY